MDNKNRQAGREFAAKIMANMQGKKQPAAPNIDLNTIIEALSVMVESKIDPAPILAALRPQMPPATDLAPLVEVIKQAAEVEEPQLDLTPVVEAIQSLVEIKADPVDLSPIATAIKEAGSRITPAKAPPATDVSPVAEAIAANNYGRELVDIATALREMRKLTERIQQNTEVLQAILKEVKQSKYVKYDEYGRIVEIGTQA